MMSEIEQKQKHTCQESLRNYCSKFSAICPQSGGYDTLRVIPGKKTPCLLLRDTVPARICTVLTATWSRARHAVTIAAIQWCTFFLQTGDFQSRQEEGKCNVHMISNTRVVKRAYRVNPRALPFQVQQEHLDVGEIEDNVVVTAAGPHEEVEKSESSSLALAQLPSVSIGETKFIFVDLVMHNLWVQLKLVFYALLVDALTVL